MRRFSKVLAKAALAALFVGAVGCVPPGGGGGATTTTTTTTTVPSWLDPGCLGTDIGVDFEYVGPENAAANISLHAPGDGPCAGATMMTATLVHAADLSAANAACLAAGFAPFANPSSQLGLSLPADAWMCTSAVADPSPGDPPVYEGCHDSPYPGTPDIYFNGRPDVLDNYRMFLVSGPTPGPSVDGTCSGYGLSDPGWMTVVSAADETDAIAHCAALNPALDAAGALSWSGYDGAPADLWNCGMTVGP